MKTKSKTLPECDEGPEAFTRFDATMGAILAVPKSILKRRERAYKKRSEAKPNRPGPERKATKPSAARASRAKG